MRGLVVYVVAVSLQVPGCGRLHRSSFTVWVPCIGHLSDTLHRLLCTGAGALFPFLSCYLLLSTAYYSSRLPSSTPVYAYTLLNSCAAYYHTHGTYDYLYGHTVL